MKVRKNHFRIGKKMHYFIEFSENTNLMIKEIRDVLKIFIKKNMKTFFTGFFRTNIPDTFKVFNFGTKSNFYALDEISQIDYLFSEDFINSIVNLEFYIYPENIELNSKFDVNNNVANIYMENCFIECGLIFDKNIYDEVETLNKLKSI